MRGVVLATMLALLLTLSGCIAANDLEASAEGGADEDGAGGEAQAAAASSWSWSSGGYTTSDQSGKLDAPSGGAYISYSAGGEGSATIIVRDAAGTVVYERNVGGSGSSSDRAELHGASGQWSVTVEIEEWSGGLTIQVQGR